MKVLIFGSSGMLGYAVTNVLQRSGLDVSALTRNDVNLARISPDELEILFKSKNPQYVINCSGVIKPMIQKNSTEDVLKVNTLFPLTMAKIGTKLGVRTIHITTDCVYSGRKGSYNELSPFDADDVYGISKLGGDHNDGMTLRTSIIGEEKGQGRSLLSWAMSQEGKEVNGFTNHKWNGVTTVTLAKVIQTIMEKDLYKNQLYHIHSPDVLTKAELVQSMSNTYQLGLAVRSIEAKDFCDRSLSSIHGLTKNLVQKTIPDQLNEMRSFFHM
jgi:dTDP-4-dehydrorhamnose reductase